MSLNTVSILDGNTFVVSDRRGDIDASPDRHARPVPRRHALPVALDPDRRRHPARRCCRSTSRPTSRCSSSRRSPPAPIYVDSHLSVVRQRAVGKGFHEEIVIENHDKQPMDLEVQLEAAADFADLFEVKDKLAEEGRALHARSTDDRLTLGYQRERFVRETRHLADQKGEVGEDGFCTFKVHLPPRTSCLDASARRTCRPHRDRASRRTRPIGASRGATSTPGSRARPAWSAPGSRCSHIYRRSLVDLAALRFRDRRHRRGALPAAGLPWFMAVFGRDSLITSFQALPFAPELAATTLRTLALFQARSEDPFRDEEPGKILHELRLGEMTAFEERPHSPYYGAADATMLFLILLEEYERWTGDRALARELEREARAAIAWIDDYGDRDGDGYVEYERRNKETGLDNQCWKDSWDSIAFADGTLAPTPRATCELQGYVYDAKRRTARLAREVWGDPGLGRASWRREAAELKRRFNQRLLDPRARASSRWRSTARSARSTRSPRTSATCSGAGSPTTTRPSSCVKHLMSDALFSGWGIRTMASQRGVVQPDRLPRRHGLAARQLVHRLGPAPLRLPRRGGAHLAARCWRRPICSTAGCPRRSAATRARRPTTRSSTRRRAARRPGRPARRCCSCARCSASTPTAST